MSPSKPVSASVILESRSLRAELRVTVDTDHSEFLCESHLSRLSENAEALIPVALASEGPQLLRQVIEKCEALLLDQASDDLSLCSPKNIFAAQSFLKANGMSTWAPSMLAMLRKLYAIEANPEISAEIAALIAKAEGASQ